jgi:3-oxoacyl-[acyl-carrier-protein] synthase II
VATNDAVWITGVGLATPLGHTYSVVADHFLAGTPGVRAVTRFDVSKHLCKVFAPIEPLPIPSGWKDADFTGLDPYEQMLLWCGTQALQDAGWWERRSPIRVGLALGMGAEWLRTWEVDRFEGGTRVRDPQLDRETLLYLTQRKLGLCGPAVTVAAACASGNHALAQARRWLRLGWADVCIAGACNLDVTPMSLACFGNLGALTRRNAAPAEASRPFDRDRDGFVMGEGGALFVLEKADRARPRGPRVYAEVAGYGASSDASHMVIPSSDPEPASRAMRAALNDAAVNPEDVHYINAHATSTPVGDRAEAGVLRTVLGDSVLRIPVSSTKGMTGHLLSSAAAVEVVACLVALERQAVPPTINLDNPDPECQLCHVPHHARPHPIQVAVSNSFGFGGSNSCLVLRKVA